MKKIFISLSLFLISQMVFSACTKKTENASEKDQATPVVHMKKELQDSVGISLTEVKKEKFISSLEVYGSISEDTENTKHITSKESGILKSFTKTVGDTVEAGEVIALVQTAQGEEVGIISPLHGIIMAQYVKTGDRVDPITSIMTVTNPDLLRGSFDVYEKDLGFIKLGQKVTVTSIAYPDKGFAGKVIFISPRVDETSRTIKIRIDVENNDHLLRFGMAVTGKIIQESETESLVVPSESLQPLEDGWVVFVKKDEEAFEMRNVEKGKETDRAVEILKGLDTGEKIAERGSFILKSEFLKGELGEEE